MTVTATQSDVPTLRLIHQLIRYAPKKFWLNFFLWTSIHTLPLALGLAVEAVFEQLSKGASAHNSAWTFVALFGLTQISRLFLFRLGIWNWVSLWYEYIVLIKRNLLDHLLTAQGARRLPDSPSEAVSRFRDDTEDVASFVENYVDITGFLLYALVAIFLLWQREPMVTVIVCSPLVLMVFLMRGLSNTIRRFRRRMRQATANVTDFIGETFNGVQAIKLSSREENMIGQLEHLGHKRRQAALSDTLLTQFIQSINTNMVSVGTGLILLLMASQMRQGSFTVGDFALFVFYLPRLANVMTFLGDAMAQSRRTGVSFERMGRLLVDAPLEKIVKRHDLGLNDETPPWVNSPQEENFLKLEHLEVRNLTAHHPSGRGIHNIHLNLKSGSFTVITGRMGSGKTTLLRALLGLIPAEGEVLWNGQIIKDRSHFFVPPRSSYAAQTPHLFSEVLKENILLGEGEERLEKSLQLSVLEGDIESFELGLETPLGSRGVKLSGGQIQRTATARMLVRPAELLIFDDLSSALDSATERTLWERIALELPATLLVVSHRKAALIRAHRIVLIKEGKIEDEGTLDELLKRSEEMRSLWYGELED